ncbi:MAG: geranylgeranylglyceryl/heptaprenylglyceryl phosphate synthase [Nitrososphaeria archaeon]
MRVEDRLREARRGGPLIFGLIDPARRESPRAIRAALESGVDAFLVGGSTLVDRDSLDGAIDEIRSASDAPVILFPGNVNGLTPRADAVLFISLLNSDDPYYVIGAQVLGAPLVKKYGLEALPTGYLVLRGGSTVSHVGRVRELPPGKPELVAMYAMAAYMMGMRFLYLEAGSGAAAHVDPGEVGAARSAHGGFLMVGGGLRSPEAAAAVAAAGADGLVFGTALETMEPGALRSIFAAAKSGKIRVAPGDPGGTPRGQEEAGSGAPANAGDPRLVRRDPALPREGRGRHAALECHRGAPEEGGVRPPEPSGVRLLRDGDSLELQGPPARGSGRRRGARRNAHRARLREVPQARPAHPPALSAQHERASQGPRARCPRRSRGRG